MKRLAVSGLSFCIVMLFLFFSGCENRRERIRRLEKERAVEPLIAIMKEPCRDYLEGIPVCEAAEALGRIGDPKALKPLIEMLRKSVTADTSDVVFYMRESFHSALKNMGEPAVPALIELLKDKEMSPCIARLLGDMGDERAVEPLIEILKHGQSSDCTYASKALKRITGQNFGYDYDKWKAWYEKSKDK